jgi:hypothetical protein
VYRVPLAILEKGAARWSPPAAGSRARPGDRRSAGGLGEFPGDLRWSAALRVPHFGNYSFRAAGRLSVDGHEILRADGGRPLQTTVSLPDGDHRIVFEAWSRRPESPRLRVEGDAQNDSWRRPGLADLAAADGPPLGLLGVFQGSQGPERRRLDGAIAAMSLSEDVRFPGEWKAAWRGTLVAPVEGDYAFAFRTNGGIVELKLDGRVVFTTRGEDDRVERGSAVPLRAGPHAVEILYRVTHAPGGIDFIWTPPGQPESVVPPSALRPADTAPGAPLPETALTVLRPTRHEPGAMTAP